MLNKIEAVGGFVLYVGVKKTAPPELHHPNRLYTKVLLEAVKRIDHFCEADCDPSDNFLLALDEHDQRSALISEVSRSMYAGPERRRHLIEPLFNLESHRYQTIQAADWIAGLVGALVPSGQIRSPTPRTSYSVVISNRGSTVSVGGAGSARGRQRTPAALGRCSGLRSPRLRRKGAATAPSSMTSSCLLYAFLPPAVEQQHFQDGPQQSGRCPR